MHRSHPHATRTSCIKLVQQRCCEHEKGTHMKKSLLTADMIADFNSKGGKVTRCGTDEHSGISKREWDRLVRGDDVEEVEPLIRRNIELKGRAGHFMQGRVVG